MKLIASLALSGVVLMSTGHAKADEEQPKYELIHAEGDFEIRDYEPYYVVSTV